MDENLFYSRANDFFTNFDKELVSKSIELQPHWYFDHICFRTSSLASYKQRKQELLCFSEFLIESEVNKRPIATFKLHKPLRYLGRYIYLLELPAPKASVKTMEGFEHIEVVCDSEFDEIIKNYKDINFSRAGLNKSYNKELKLDLGKYSLKFHHQSLESVIRLEKNKKVFDTLTKLNILNDLVDYQPLVAGTFPLGIYNDQSDVDVIITHSNLDAALEFLTSKFKKRDKFVSYKSRKGNVDYIVASFEFEGVLFEIYGEDQPSVKQRAYRHYQIEERLLLLGGDKFLEKVRYFRNKGNKTEPAFSNALGLREDPYLELLKLHKFSDEELVTLIEKSYKLVAKNSY